MVRSILFLLSVVSVTMTLAQKSEKDDPFRQEWHQIDSLISKGLPQSAAKIGRKILEEATRRKDAPNTIRARLLLMSVEEANDGNTATHSIQQADSMIQVSTGAEKALWQSITAELYWQYFQQNRWTIFDRTPLAAEPPADIATWDAATFITKASELYQASILNSELLKAIPVERYTPLVIEGKNTRHLRPTLYDFLAFRAIEFFQHDEKDVIRPAYQFQMDGTRWFETAERFSDVKVNPADPGALHFRALHTYQQLLAFHMEDARPDALIDADLHRLAFVHQYSVHAAKDSLYRNALQALARRYPDAEATAQVVYRLLQFEFNSTHSAQQDSLGLRRLLEQLNALIARFPGSEGASNAEQLRHAIMGKSLGLQTEQVLLPNENNRLLVTYRNLGKIFLRLYRWPEELPDRNRRLDEKKRNQLLRSKPLKAWEVNLPGTEDLHEHRTEIKLDPLPAGNYLIVASARPDFGFEQNTLQAASIQVSALSMVVNNQQGNHSLVALHRKSGMPIRGAQVVFQENHWDTHNRKYSYRTIGQTRTDEDGRAAIAISNHKSSINRIQIAAHGDTLQTDGYFGPYGQWQDDQQETTTRTFLFTDRALYRPGQTIHFKGIVIENNKKENNNSVLPNHEAEITLYDTNNQRVTSLKLTTNGFGSFAGKFTAPEGGLTGTMRIETSNGQAYFAVEEYKRPRFQVTFDTLKANAGLNEQITVRGKAAAYAGNPVDGAEVKYRVVRRARFPYYWRFYRWGQPQSPEMEIANGTIQTQPDGSFEVTFTTIPDKQLAPETLPVFSYTVYADVTDINGETQSNNHVIRAGYRSLQLAAQLAEQLDARQPQTLAITTQNLNGVATPADVEVSVAPLRFPGKIYRKRLWENPDRHVMTEAEFRRYFPDDEYTDEADHLNWPVGSTTWTTKLNTGMRQTATLPTSVWKQEGWHVITLKTTDPQGNKVTEKKYTYVAGLSDGALTQVPLLILTPKSVLSPGDTLAMTVKTGFDSTYVLETNSDINPEFSAFSDVRTVERTIDENDRGGLGFSWLYVYNSRVYTATRQIAVPWSNRDLQLEWATHRDKLLPGETEEWRLTIKGHQKEAVAAELLAGLYDASLDALKSHAWYWDKLSPIRDVGTYWQTNQGFGALSGYTWHNTINGARPAEYIKRYDELLNYPVQSRLHGNRFLVRGIATAQAPARRTDANAAVVEELAVAGYDQQQKAATAEAEDTLSTDIPSARETTPIPARTNLQETAFFFPQLSTDTAGNVSLRFTMPEALTEWKLMAFAHTTDWKTGYLQGSVKTQKDLMVMPNLPRFLRQGDDIQISSKISNISGQALRGVAQLEILDAVSLEHIDGFGGTITGQDFNVAENQSTTVNWTLRVPDDRFEPIVVRITAKAGNFTDGEENTLPVMTNRMMVTETLPLPVRGNESKAFSLHTLLNPESNTLTNHALTVEFTGNPAWYAVQALPYLMEYPYECAEQVFNRFYSTALAAHIVGQSPKVKAIFDKWATKDTAALLSNLEKNQELKSALLEETPWVMEAADESQQKRRIALLFDSHKLAQGLQHNLSKLAEIQRSDGSFPWFRGMMADRYITQYIATGIARLQRLGVETAASETAAAILAKAVDYVDRQIKADHDRLVADQADFSKQHIEYPHVQYLYMRSLLQNQPHSESRAAYEFYMAQAAKFWAVFNPYLKGQLALAFHRGGNTKTTAEIMASLRETASHSPELGMYWKSMPRGYWWYEAPIEAQALLIEAFAEVAEDTGEVDDLKVWLLKQKQTQHWGTTKSTADAVYALLLQGSDWLVNEPSVTVSLGTETIRSANETTEAGTGYFKKRFDADAVTSDMGNIAVKVDKTANDGVAWGAVYWQYFEDLDKITAAETPLSLRKQLYVERNTDRGPVLEEITERKPLKVGDKVTVRIELRVDRDMEHVHLKDMRAACFEPINVLSGFRYQGGLGYYESTRDVATNFFFDRLRKGTYVFEYPVFVSQAGDFSNGISTIQCMYAPEFSSHSDGIRVKVSAM
ncbi:alpha-2-macroglobulin [Parapedobacter deserti]|uniref:Alpha-2-macroglobulin n=1 Tax=Parapedobacter deserti TaxID=1912957 RepID=A0ABV7JNK6_9SPHI